ncbi:hypothetical protein [Cellulomonas sp. URHB0016]
MRNGARIALGVLLAVIGSIWTLQGLGYVAGSAMTGVTVWAIIGPVVAIAGVILVVRSFRERRRGRRPADDLS